MTTLNRSAFIVRSKEPYLQWAAGLDDEAPRSAEGLRSKVSIYLVPENATGEAETPPRRDYFLEVFELELESRSLDEELWPRERGLETFWRWFEVVGESIVIDLAGARREREEL